MEIISTYSLLPLVSSILVFALGLFVWLKNPKEWLHILFFLYDFTIAIWLFGTFLLFNATTDVDKLLWDRFIYGAVVFIPIFLYHFGLIYCKILPKQRITLVVGYLLAFLFLPISQYSPHFVDGLYKYSWGAHSVAHTYHHFFLAYFFFYFILFFINLVVHYRNSTGIHKTQVRLVLIGYGILDIVGPMAFLPAYGIPIYPVIFLSAIPFAGLLAYAIIRYQALDVRIIGAEVIVTSLNILLIGEIFFSRSTTEIALRAVVALLIFVFSVFLILSVKKEIKRREEIMTLANALRKANVRLQELDRQKTEFLSIASHQLRTPLSIINGYLELIKEGDYGKVSKELKQILDNMDESNGRLVKLVDEFLNISRIEQGRTKFTFEQMDMNVTVDSVVAELKDRAEQKGLKLHWKKPVRTFVIAADEEKIRHVVFNFVDNAIKYSDKGAITVVVGEETAGVTVRVQDRGLGFTEQDEYNFFQKFYRGENVKGVNVTGTGLGLYVCRMFIEAHHGRVWAKSAGLQKGSEFGFWVPIEHDATVNPETSTEGSPVAQSAPIG